jgi:hypothetical protein
MILLPWKIFRIANWVQLLYSLAGLLFIVGTLIKNGFPPISFFILFPIGLLAMACNNYVNLYIFRRHFPDKPIGSDLKKVHTVFLILSILFSLLLVVVIIIGSMEEFTKENLHEYTGKFILVVFFLVLLNWMYILLMQVRMDSFIKRENYNSLAKSISSIGSE